MLGHGSLNHLYRLVWSKTQGAWIAVAETTRGQGKGSSRKLLVAVVGLSSALAQASPEGGLVVSGTGSIAQSGATTTITQTTRNLSLNWDSFNIAARETVTFNQPSAAAIAVNRIMDSNGTQILGNLNANGQVYLINPNGILFGQNAQVNVGALVASTLDLDDASLNSDSRSFSGAGTGSVINQGTINAADGGYVALLGNSISNQGTITAPGGSVALGAGSAVTLTFADNSLVQMQVDESLLDNLADNGGLIQANGGRVLLSAGARDSLLASVVNNTGVIEARSVENHDGVIVLLGGMAAGTTKVAGTLDASAPDGGDGGFIETSAAHVNVADGTVVTTLAANGQTGQWLIDPSDYTIAASGGNITGAAVSRNLASSNIRIETTGANGDIYVNDAVTWGADNSLTLDAHRDININQSITATGENGKLVLEYGQDATDGVISGVAADYNVNAPVNLQAGNNFSTQLGSTGTVKEFIVITSLGEAGSTTTTDLQGIDGNLSGHYALGDNIDAADTLEWNDNAGFDTLGTFSGSFDGLGHSIANLSINSPTTDYIGLFRIATAGSVITNVGLLDASVTGKAHVGGLVGYDNGGTISNSYITGNVAGELRVGGLVGSSDLATISNSYATANVTATDNNAGGLVGHFNNSKISNSYASGSLSSGDFRIGGLVAESTDSSTISNSYWDTVTTGQSRSPGGGSGKTTADLLKQTTYAGFDFGNTWFMVEGSTRPFLRNEYSTSIGNAHQLQLMSLNLAADYTLTNNLDLAAELANPSGMWGTASTSQATGITSGFAPISYGFSGSFDGLGHTISNLSIDRPSTNFVGLFGFTATGSVIDNVGLLGASVSGNDKVGGLVGRNGGTISNSYATGSVHGEGYDVGGLVGLIVEGTVSNSYATGSVSSTGGNTGGLVGRGYNGIISNSYATGITASSGSAGGLVGSVSGGSISNSYWDTVTTGQSTSAGGGADRTTSQLLTQATYRGFDFNNTWFMVEGSTRPFLRSEYSTTITNAHQLQLMAIDLSADYTLTNNLDLATELANPSGLWGGSSAGFFPIGNHSTGFSGSIDGLGHTISNLSIDRPSTSYIGLFGDTTAGSLIDNLGLLDASVTGANRVATLAGSTYGTVNNSYATGSVNGDIAGVLIGENNGTISNSYATGNVSGLQRLGGLVGFNNNNNKISNSYADVTVSGSYETGGLVGYNGYNAEISNSYATGSVTNNTQFAGGLVGVNYNNAKIINSYATGPVSGIDGKVGGLVGSDTGTITLSYWDTATTGQSTSAGNKDSGTGLSTADIHKKASFSDEWDLADTGGSGAVWRIYEDHSAPLLTHFMTDLTLADTAVTYNSAAQSGGDFTSIDKVLGAAATETNAGIYNDYHSTQQGFDIKGGGLIISQADLSVTGLTATAKTYDANTTATLGGTAAIAKLGTDDVSVSGTASGLFADKNVDTGKAITVTGNSLSGIDAGNYNLVQQTDLTADILKADLLVTGLAATAKTYDANTTATLGGTAAIAKLGTDDVTVGGTASGLFADKNVDTGKAITVTGNSISGDDAGNYNLLQQAGLSADISKADLSVTGLAATAKTYDATTDAILGGTAAITKLGSDDVSVGGTASGLFADKNVDTGKTIPVTGNSLSGTDAGNYNLLQQAGLSADISKADLSVTGLAATAKTYDATTDAILGGTAAITKLGSDDVSVGGTASGLFADKNVADGKTITVTGNSLSGTDA
uniref:YDG domain-containing protein n=1 Tax=Neptunomonas antarctica TaxID=619304 RepID=UPI0006C7CB34